MSNKARTPVAIVTVSDWLTLFSLIELPLCPTQSLIPNKYRGYPNSPQPPWKHRIKKSFFFWSYSGRNWDRNIHKVIKYVNLLLNPRVWMDWRHQKGQKSLKMFGHIMNTEVFRISLVTNKLTQTSSRNVPHFGGWKELRSALGLMSTGDSCSL